jgi:uncharacterized protein YcbX
MPGTPIATIARIFRYPVKSMQGQELDEAFVGRHGLAGDRRYAFVQAGSRSPFPWLTGRELSKLLLYRPEYDQPFTDPQREPPVSVVAPDGARYDIFAPALRERLEREFGRPVFLLRDMKGQPDIAQVSLFNLELAAAIGAAAGCAVDPRRFRANLYLQPTGAGYDETTLPGRTLTVGDNVRLAVTMLDPRCEMITLDPETAAREPAVLRTVANGYRNNAGLYAVVLRPGTVRRGDAVVLEE